MKPFAWPLCGIVLSLSLATQLIAQAAFDPNIGLPLNLGDDTIAANRQLGFSFTFPGGVVTSAIDIDSNGRILRGGTGGSNFTESVGELLSGIASICPYWTDLDPTAGDDVYFNALPGLALITWQDMQLFGGSAPFTFQCQLRPDDSIVFVFDDRVPSDSAIVGLSAGGGVANPGASNLSAASASTTVDAMYELFGNFDLFSVSVGFARNGSGWRSMSGVSGFPVRASVAPFGRSCRSAFDLTPVASGGYAVSVSQRFVTDFGVSLGISGNDAVVGPVALAFPFAMPGGSFVTTISVDSNGRILPPGADPSDPTPSVAELLNETHATIAPFWTDLDLTVLGGDVRFASTPSSATVTWENIAQAGGADPLTVQATLRADGSMTFAYFDTTDFDVELRDVIVGVSPGSVAVDPGSRDWSIGFFSGGSTVYEWFTMGGAKLDLQLSVTALSTPLQGQSFDVRLDGVPAGSAAGLLLIGFVPIEAPLDPIGFLGCTLLVNPVFTPSALRVFESGSTEYSLPIGSSPSLNGGNIVIQGVTITPNAGVLPFVFGNAARGTIGF